MDAIKIDFHGFSVFLFPKLKMRLIRRVRDVFLRELTFAIQGNEEQAMKFGMQGIVKAVDAFVLEVIQKVEQEGRVFSKQDWIDDLTPEEYNELVDLIFKQYNLTVDKLYDLLMVGIEEKKR